MNAPETRTAPYKPVELAKLLGKGRSTIDRLIFQGKIRHILIGKEKRVTVSEFKRICEEGTGG